MVQTPVVSGSFQAAMLPLLSFTGGLAFLCGLNLYLTTFLAGVAVRQGWLDASLHPALAVLGHPVLITVAAVLFVIEFVADKVPWFDSLWDAVHTLIRPLGAVGLTLAISQGASLDASATTLLALAAGGISLCTHLTKSGVRLLINASPEPVTNILASLAEDVSVVLLLLLLVNAPVTGFAACLALFAAAWMVLPRLFRLVKTSLFLTWKKIFGRVPAGSHTGPLPAALTVAQESLLVAGSGPEVLPPAWAVPCVSGKARGLRGHRANLFGTLIAPKAQPGILLFVSKRWFRRRAGVISLAGASVRQEHTFLSENLVIHRPDDGLHLIFRFSHAEGPLVKRLVDGLNAQLGLTAPLSHTPPAVLSPRGEPESTWSSLPPVAH